MGVSQKNKQGQPMWWVKTIAISVGDHLSQAMLGCSGSDVVIGSGRIFGYKVFCDFWNTVLTIGSDG